MNARNVKCWIGHAVFGFATLGSLVACTGYPMAIFTVKAYDSAQEMWALTFALATPFFACLVSLWQRSIAGIWLIFAGCYFEYGMLMQRAFVMKAKGSQAVATSTQTLSGSTRISFPLILLGIFWLATELLGWPYFNKKDPRDGEPVSTADIAG